MMLLAFSWTTPLYILFILASVFLILIVLIQPPKGEGLASAFSGVGSESFFGSRAYQQITYFTAGLAIALLLLALLINWVTRAENAPGEPTPTGTEEPTDE